MTQQSHTPEMAAINSATMEWLQQLIEIVGSEIIGHEDIELLPAISQMTQASR